MTELDQRIAIAQACGCTWTPPKNLIHPSTEKWWRLLPEHADAILKEMTFDLPDYFHDLNAMHQAVKTLTDDEWETFWDNLIQADFRLIVEAEAAERAEAFLKTKGLWKE